MQDEIKYQNSSSNQNEHDNRIVNKKGNWHWINISIFQNQKTIFCHKNSILFWYARGFVSKFWLLSSLLTKLSSTQNFHKHTSTSKFQHWKKENINYRCPHASFQPKTCAFILHYNRQVDQKESIWFTSFYSPTTEIIAFCYKTCDSVEINSDNSNHR